MAGFRIETRLRPCYVTTISGSSEKALFHCWSQESELYAPSVRKGGHNGGTVSGMMAICELENGVVVRVLPRNIRFVPGEFNAYIWNDEGEEENNEKIHN